MLLILLVPIIGSAAAFPLSDTLDGLRFAIPQDQKALYVSTKTHSTEASTERKNPSEPREMVEDKTDKTLLSKALRLTTDCPEASSDLETNDSEAGKKETTQGRRHKAMFVDYPLIPQIYSSVPAYEIDNSAVTETEQLLDDSKRYQESNIFYIRLPPTPYMFVPGLGYISQPPTYSTAAVAAAAAAAGLKPQVVPVVPQLHQLFQLPAPHARPTVRPAQPAALQTQTVNPFIKLPIDFVSNGKPTSVYQWQKKPGKKPADSPITNLDNLSADFVSNGKPTSIYQWQTNLKPAKRPDSSLNSLDMGPYNFNGKPTSLYLLGPDGSSAIHQPIRQPDYQDDYRSAYY